MFVNACVREDSRTKHLADCLLAILHAPVTELRLADHKFPAVDEAFLDRRDALKEKRDFSDPMFALARQFAGADEIVIAAPFWDLSFPALLKQYFEQIKATGLDIDGADVEWIMLDCEADIVRRFDVTGTRIQQQFRPDRKTESD